MTPKYHPFEAACAILGVSESKLYDLINAGEIAACGVGSRGKRGPRDWVILDEDLEAYLRANRVPSRREREQAAKRPRSKARQWDATEGKPIGECPV